MGSSAGFIVGGIQIVAGALLSILSVGTLSTIGVSLIISGATTIAATALAPKPATAGSWDSSPTYGFDGLQNVAFEGGARPIVLGGPVDVAPVYISAMTEQSGKDQYLNAVLLVSTGGDNGIESISDIRLNDEAISHYKDITVTTRLGTSTQSAVKGFEKVGIPFDIGVTLQSAGEQVTYTTKTEVDEVRLVFAWPGGLFKSSDKGIGGERSYLKIEYQDPDDPVGRWKTTAPPTNSDGSGVVGDGWSREPGYWKTYAKQSTVLRLIAPITFSTKKKWTIRVTNRYGSDTTHVRTVTLLRVEEVADDNRDYAGHALIYLKAVGQAQLSGGLPKVVCTVKGWKITQMNGQTAWTANNVENLRALLLNAEDGVGRLISSSDLDDTFNNSTFWTVRQACLTDALNLTKSPHDQPRHELALILDTTQTAMEWISHILFLMRAEMVEWGGKLRLVRDQSASSVATFDGRQSPAAGTRPILANEDGSLDLQVVEIDGAQRTTHLKVAYWDKRNNYERRWTDDLTDPDYTAGDPRVKDEVFLPGVTREAEAVRQGRYLLNRARLTTLMYEWGVGIGDLNLLPMDVVTLYADSPTLSGVTVQVLGSSYSGGHSGRIIARQYDAAVYTDTSDTLQKKAPSLTRAQALKAARAIPKGATNVTIREVI